MLNQQVEVPEECIQKIKEIETDVLRYIELHKDIPSSYAVSKRELEIVKEARKYGIIPQVEFKGEMQPVSIRYGGYYG